jgi:hypothetical protein
LKSSPELDPQAAQLLELLQHAGIDAMPVRDEPNENYTQQLILFFGGDDEKFVISVDPRTPIVLLKGVHDAWETSAPGCPW